MAGFTALCHYLISADAKVGPANKEGKKPSDYAISKDMVKLFAESEESTKTKKKKKKKQML